MDEKKSLAFEGPVDELDKKLDSILDAVKELTKVMGDVLKDTQFIRRAGKF